MYIKIYFDEKPVYLCDALTEALKDILHHPDAIFIDELSAPAIKSLLHEIVKPDFHAGVLLHPDLAALKTAFFKHFTLIEAAGGLLENENQEFLFIYRLNKWDLPKGKVEDGEAIASCAVREVEEETGAANIKLHHKIGETYHTYNAYGKHFLKTTHWYYMSCPSEQELIPQIEESISALRWVKYPQIDEPLSNTYPSIIDVITLFSATKALE